MSPDLATAAPAALLGAAVCGLAGLGVPDLIRRIPEPVNAQPEDPPRYLPVAATPGLRVRAALLATVAGALVAGAVGFGWALLPLLPLVPIGVALAIVDLHTHLLPTKVIWPSLGATVVLAGVGALVAGEPAALLRAAVAGLVVFALFHALWWIYPRGMGYGDVRLSGLLGFALGCRGWAEVAVGMYGAFLVFAVLGVLRAAARRDREALRAPLPFGPFLLGGAVAGLVLGEPLWVGLVTR